MSSVPQGSVLDSLVFLIMIGDINKDVIHSTTASFADDICKSIGAREDVIFLQEDLCKIYDWAKINNMTFNDSKFQLLRSGTNQGILDSTSLLSSDKQVIASSQHVKCLGINLDADGTFQHLSLSLSHNILLRYFHKRSVNIRNFVPLSNKHSSVLYVCVVIQMYVCFLITSPDTL